MNFRHRVEREVKEIDNNEGIVLDLVSAFMCARAVHMKHVHVQCN